MLQSSKLLRPPPRPVCSQDPSASLPRLRLTPPQKKLPCSLDLDQPGVFSRRALAFRASSPLLLLVASQVLDPLGLSKANAEEGEEDTVANASVTEQDENVVAGNPLKAVEGEEYKVDNASVTEQEGNVAESDNPSKAVEEGEDEVANASVTEQEVADNPSKAVEGEEEKAANASVTEQKENVAGNPSSCSDKTPTKRAFIDISVDGQPQGRVVIGLYENNVPTGAARFSNLVSGSAGVSYRRKEFTKIMPNYIQHGGVRSYGVDAEMAQKTGSNLGSESLAAEWERQNVTCPGTKMVAGSVGIVVRNPNKPPPKMKLVARKGKLEIDEEQVGSDPNGTEFVIASKDSPELDASVLVVGRVLEGMDVVEKIEQVKTVQENTSSPYFRVAKLIGDKRAVVAERGFNRPYSKVVVTNCSVIK